MTDAAEDLDLRIARRLNAPREGVWKAWTNPAQLATWWCPKPWTTEVVNFDFKPGGAFETVMRGPDGEEEGSTGAFLDIAPFERIVFTSALQESWWPIALEPTPISVVITMADDGGGTYYTARVLHADRADRDQHEAMGFFGGWGICIDQLEAVARALHEPRGSTA